MSGFILCRGKYAQKPYYISNTSINIYSMEELCYYIYNNIYLIGADLIEPGLIEYIDKELKESELARQLEFLISQNAGLSELVITILRYVDFYSEHEIMELKEVIDKLDTQNVAERLKARADNFLSNRRYSSAIRNYELIVYGNADRSLPASFYGDAWHNMGVAYARMYVFSEAEVCFKTAYELNKDERSLKLYTSAKCLAEDCESEPEDELGYVTKREIETIMDHVPDEMQYSQVKTAFELKKEGHVSECYEALDAITDNWKKQYRNYIK